MKAYFGSNGKHESVIETPDWLMEELWEEFGSEHYDPCPVGPIENGLVVSWSEKICKLGLGAWTYVNPPYTRGVIGQWVKKCREEHLDGLTPIVLLIPAYTDTAYFHDYIYNKHNVEIRFLRGRIKFKGYEKNKSSFPSMLVVFN